MAESDREYGLVMPFISVASKGGPHDDEAYTCGWEMGALDVHMQHVRPRKVQMMIHTSNEAQADLIAMRHRYTVEISTGDDGWSYLDARRGDADA